MSQSDEVTEGVGYKGTVKDFRQTLPHFSHTVEEGLLLFKKLLSPDINTNQKSTLDDRR